MIANGRTPEAAWQHHVMAVVAKDIDAFVQDFTEDCLVINNPKGGHASGVYRKHEGVRKWCEQFFTLFGAATEIGANPPFMIDNVVFAQWEIHGRSYDVSNGVDTFVIKDGLFQLVTCLYRATPK